MIKFGGIYNETYTREGFQREVQYGDTISLGSNRDTVPSNKNPWPVYIFRGYETCQYQYGHGCTDCQGKLLLVDGKGRKSAYCATNQRNEGPALIAARWNKNKLPDELFEI